MWVRGWYFEAEGANTILLGVSLAGSRKPHSMGRNSVLKGTGDDLEPESMRDGLVYRSFIGWN